MRQRLALERALLHNPRLLLLDEPFTGLDDASTMALIERLRELRASGCIMLVATHDLDVGEAVLDRAVILHDGRLIASEPDVRGLRKRYQDRLQAGARVMSAFWRVVWIVARKDLAIEARSRELLNTTIFFALSCVIVFSVSFVGEGGDGRALGDAAAGILWIAIAFSGTLALGRTFERERYGDTLRALLLAPGTRAAVYVGKLVGIVALLIATEIVIVPLVALLFQARLGDHFVLVAALLLFGTVGFATVGTLFAAMLTRARSRDVLLPILLYPVTIPVMIAGVRGTSALLAVEPQLDMARLWVMLLLAFDVVFVTLSLWTFEALMTE